MVNISIDVSYKARFDAAMNDDFNTPIALSVLFDIAKALNKVKADIQQAQPLVATLRYLGSILGILQDNSEIFLKGIEANNGLTTEKIEQLIQDRIKAKKNKDWAMADKIRDELKGQGIILEDTTGNKTTWRRE
jgi:cysteinyl-tRNA synthetase